MNKKPHLVLLILGIILIIIGIVIILPIAFILISWMLMSYSSTTADIVWNFALWPTVLALHIVPGIILIINYCKIEKKK